MAVGWPGRVVVLACVLAGCGGQALPQYRGAPSTEPPPVMSTPAGSTAADAGAAIGTLDAATSSGLVGAVAATIPIVQRAPTSVLTSDLLWNAEVLAADDDGIYWVTLDNRLWILPAWSDTARVLADDLNPSGGVVGGDSLLVQGNYIFWSTSVMQPGATSPGRPLHRTSKTGTDVVMFSDSPSLLAADAGYLYYVQGDVEHADLAIAALPLAAHPGATPVTLTPIPPGMEVSALAVDDENMYWTEYAVGSTMFEGTGPIFAGGKGSLLAGARANNVGELVPLNAYLLAPSDGRLYFGFAPQPGGDAVASLDDVNGIVATSPLPAAVRVVPLPAGQALVALDGWLVSSTAEVPNPGGKIYAVGADAVTNGGQAAVQIADDVLVPPVAGLPGLVFVDGGGHLVAVTAANLGAAVAAGQR